MSALDEGGDSPKYVPQNTILPEPVKLAVGVILLLCVGYLFYSNSQFKKQMGSEIDRLVEHVETLEENGSLVEASLSGQILGIREELDTIRAAVSR